MTIARVLSLLLALLAPPVFAQTVCPSMVGAAILHAAWLTPKFQSCSFDSIRPLSGDTKEVVFKIVGDSRISKLSDKEVWVKGVAVFDGSWHLRQLKWGDYKAAVPPGAITGALGKYAKYRADNS